MKGQDLCLEADESARVTRGLFFVLEGFKV